MKGIKQKKLLLQSAIFNIKVINQQKLQSNRKFGLNLKNNQAELNKEVLHLTDYSNSPKIIQQIIEFYTRDLKKLGNLYTYQRLKLKMDYSK